MLFFIAIYHKKCRKVLTIKYSLAIIGANKAIMLHLYIRIKEKNMIAWKKIEAGEYQSLDNRFYILKTYNRFYGNHWVLFDRNEKDYYKSQHDENSLLDCKLKAEALL